jgi:hypothetical protein
VVELNPYRRRHSGVAAQNGLWEVHFDTCDFSRVWVRNHLDSGWIQAGWTHLSSAPVPFGEQIWNRARRILAERAERSVDQAAITAVAEELLDRNETGARRGMIVSGPQTSGKTTAIKELGRTHELRVRSRYPGQDRIPVVYVATPPKGSPKSA